MGEKLEVGREHARGQLCNDDCGVAELAHMGLFIVLKCCLANCSIVLLRLEGFETQDTLVGYLKQATAGLAQCRKDMVYFNDANVTWEAVTDVLSKAKPFMAAFKKHSATAQTLKLASTKICAPGPLCLLEYVL